MLKGKTAVITGANRGIGRAVLELFAENGADIIACCRTVNNDLETQMTKVAERCSVKINIQTLDFTSEQSVKNTAREIVQGKRCDILINCAGITYNGLFQMTSINNIRNIFEVNFFNQMAFTQSISRLMSKQQLGVIVNVASSAGIEAIEGSVAYGTSKAALIHSTRIMAAELSRYNIRVNAVAPGLTETDMFKQNTEKGINAFKEKCLMHRFGKPEEIAQVILFLSSGMSSFVTGQTIRVDGGLL